MNAVDMILQEQHLAELRERVCHTDGTEGAAYLLLGRADIKSDPWDRSSRLRLLSHEVVPIPPEEMISASSQHVSWGTGSFVRLLQQAQNRNLIVGIVHSHPQGLENFSEQDDANEPDLAQLAHNRNGASEVMASLLLSAEGSPRARLWRSPKAKLDCEKVSVVGKSLAIHPLVADQRVSHEIWHRQALAFGDALNDQLRSLKVGIVGCGATGSATAMLLARLGVGQILLIDEDIVEPTNLNRLHGAKRADADAMRPKVEVLAREIAGLGLGVRPYPICSWVGDSRCRDALRSCDVIFGCTDDHAGRMFLNRFAFFYLIPLIDLGLAIQPRALDGFSDLTGRVTVLAPGAPCLLCRNIVDPQTAREEDLRRSQPEEYARQKAEAYVRGAGNPAPAVVSFTTATACMAVNELIQGLTGFKGPDGWCWNRTYRFDLHEDHRPGALRNPDCIICERTEIWGRGDMDPFLDRVG